MAFGFNDNERRGDDNDRQESGYGQQEGEYGRQNEGSHNASSGGPYGQVPGRFDDNEATNQAMSHYGANDDEHRSMFQNALQSAQNRFQNRRDDDDDDFDEQGAVQAHQSMYDGSGNASASPHNMGAAGAMQALKMFTGGSGNSAPQSQSGFMGMAMAEASKIFGQSTVAIVCAEH